MKLVRDANSKVIRANPDLSLVGKYSGQECRELKRGMIVNIHRKVVLEALGPRKAGQDGRL